MNSLLRAIAGVVIASSSVLATAQTTTLTFDDLGAGTTNLIGYGPYPGVAPNYVFSLPLPVDTFLDPATGGPGGSVEVLASNATYNTGPGNNISVFAPTGTTDLQYSAFSLAANGGGPFYFGSVDVAGCCQAAYAYLSFADNTNVLLEMDGIVNAGQTFYNLYSDRALNSIQFAGVTDGDTESFAAFDNIVLSRSPIAPIPEPSSYAMMIAGLGALALVARRRKGKTQD